MTQATVFTLAAGVVEVMVPGRPGGPGPPGPPASISYDPPSHTLTLNITAEDFSYDPASHTLTII